MKQTNYKRPSIFLGGLLTILALLIQGSVFGQGITSSAINGSVTDSSGNISGAEIKVTHEPTGTVYKATSNQAGRFNVRGLRVGGPYTIEATSAGYQSFVRKGIYLELSRTLSVNAVLSDSDDVYELEEFTVQADEALQYGASSAGAGSVIGGNQLSESPALNKSFNDISRLNPYAVLQDGSSGAGELVVAGQNNRMNSIQIDGVKINDQFGLGGSGNPSLANPIALETIEEVAIEVSPYDVRQSGFTGATVNAVTKSGSNAITGSVYYFYEGEDMRGDNPITDEKDLFEETTQGFTLGGPIIKDRLFFFASYEELERDIQAPTAGFTPDPTDLQLVIDKMIDDYGFDPGDFGSDGPSTLNDEKSLVKIDWQINEKHRASLRWNKTEGNNPQFTEFDDFNSFSPETNLTSHWYTDTRSNESYVFQMFSDWSDNFSTELRIGRSDFDSTPINPNVFPEIIIDNFEGTTRIGGTTSGGELYFGRDDSRHSNLLSTDVENFYLGADWTVENHAITFGIDREESTFFNLFLQETFAEIEFEGLAGFLADEIDRFDRAYGIEGTPIGAESDFTVTGFFVQDSWQVNEKLGLNFGLRYDTVEADNTQPENPGKNGQTFEEIFGVPNTNTVDGTDLLAPRFSFNYDIGDENPIKLTGGIGRFLGRSPWVWISNTFSNNGVSSVDISAPPSGFNRADGGGLLNYLANDFDPENPVFFADPSALDPTARSQVDVLQDGFELPSMIRTNLRLERQFATDSPWSAWAEILYTDHETALYTKNLNIEQIGTTPDGRPLYSGSPFSGNGLSPDYRDVFQLSNSSGGDSTNISFGIDRYLKNNWWFNATYTWGEANDVSNQGSSTASSNWQGNPALDPNAGTVTASEYETEHRILLRAGYNWEWKEGWETRFSIVYEGRSGQNYSLVFDGDYNGDGNFNIDNDLFYVPTGMDDPILDIENSIGLEEMFAFLDQIGASGGNTARNQFRTDFRHRIDISIVQDIPLGERLKGQVFLNIMNFGNLVNSNHGVVDEVPFGTLTVAEGSITDEGKIAYEFKPIEETTVRTGLYSNLSRWRIQTGFKLKF
ncbi:TonB-dependent receptor [Puniceicoccaceae bacterium K14]|nr:TonB-dependent receptor [Puniceicoccaceae bacterium K14]